MPAKTPKSAQHLEDAVLFEPVIHPRIFAVIERLCRDSITYGQNHRAVRGDVFKLIEEIRALSPNTPEAVALVKLLDRTDPTKEHARPAPQRDQIEILLQIGSIDTGHEAAALEIRGIWTGFGRFLSVSARNYEKAGGGHGRVLHPLDVMGEDLLNLWHDRYRPWLADMRRLTHAGPRGAASSASIILWVVVENRAPNDLDGAFGLPKGTALAALKAGLGSYGDGTHQARQGAAGG